MIPLFANWSLWDYVWAVVILEWIIWLVGRRYLPGTPKTEVSQWKGTPDDALFVHVPGLVGDPRTQHQRVKWLFQKHGSMAYVYYDSSRNKSADRMSVNAVVESMYVALKKWHAEHPNSPIVLIGTSLGARIAFRAAAKLRQAGIETKAILWDPPTGFKDLTLLQQIFLVGGVLVYNLPVLHLLLLIRPIIKGLVQAPPDKQIAPFVKDNERRYRELKETVTQARRWSPLFFVSQSLSLVRPLGRGNAAGWGPEDVFIIQSEHDDVVKSTAHVSWTKRLGGGYPLPSVPVPGTYHAGSGLNPEAYVPELSKAIKWVLRK